jgi:cobalamin synthase
VRVSPRRSIFVRVIVGMLMVMVLMIMMVSMIVMTVIVMRRVMVVARRHGGANGDGTVQRLQKR